MGICEPGKHGWRWGKHNPSRCGRYAVGHKFPLMPFYVNSCHNTMKAARQAMAKLKRCLERPLVGGKAPKNEGAKVQTRDKNGGAVRAEIKLKKPESKRKKSDIAKTRGLSCRRPARGKK